MWPITPSPRLFATSAFHPVPGGGRRSQHPISVLSGLEPILFRSEEDLLSQLRPGVDGLFLQEGLHRGTFLPAVWETLPDKRVFLRELKQKAKLDRDYWSDSLSVSRYTTESFA